MNLGLFNTKARAWRQKSLASVMNNATRLEMSDSTIPLKHRMQREVTEEVE